jgi:hypothetical protein
MELILIIVILVLLFGGGGGYWGRRRGFWWSNLFVENISSRLLRFCRHSVGSDCLISSDKAKLQAYCDIGKTTVAAVQKVVQNAGLSCQQRIL